MDGLQTEISHSRPISTILDLMSPTHTTVVMEGGIPHIEDSSQIQHGEFSVANVREQPRLLRSEESSGLGILILRPGQRARVHLGQGQNAPTIDIHRDERGYIGTYHGMDETFTASDVLLFGANPTSPITGPNDRNVIVAATADSQAQTHGMMWETAVTLENGALDKGILIQDLSGSEDIEDNRVGISVEIRSATQAISENAHAPLIPSVEQQRPHEMTVFNWINPVSNVIAAPQALRLDNRLNDRYIVSRADYNAVNSGVKDAQEIAYIPVAPLRDMEASKQPLLNIEGYSPVGAISLGQNEYLRVTFGDKESTPTAIGEVPNIPHISVGRTTSGGYAAVYEHELLDLQEGIVYVVGTNPQSPTGNPYGMQLLSLTTEPGEKNGIERTHAMFWITKIQNKDGAWEDTLVVHDLSQTSGVYVDLFTDALEPKAKPPAQSIFNPPSDGYDVHIFDGRESSNDSTNDVLAQPAAESRETADTATLLAGAATDMGVGTPAKLESLGKKAVNEDVFAMETITWSKPEDEGEDIKYKAQLYLVADGMGGHLNGAKAAQITRDAFLKNLPLFLSKGQSFGDALIAAAKQAHYDILDAFKEDLEVIDHIPTVAGATLAAALVDADGEGAGIGIGDARIYSFPLEPDKDDEVIPLTHDQSKIQDMIDTGEKKEDERYTYPQRNRVRNGVGVSPLTFNPVKISRVLLHLSPNDLLMLCSDGVWESMNTQERRGEMRRIASQRIHPSQVAQEIIDSANENGADDNLTVIAVRKAA